MSDKVNSMHQREHVDDNKAAAKSSKSAKHSIKHSNCQSVPSTLITYGHNQAAASSSHSPTDGKHHHHHHHGHHQSHHVIHRTTSESLRLGGEIKNTDTNSSLSNSTSISGSSGTSSSGGNQQMLGSAARKPKTSSFQITSVTVGNKLSADNGDDSADDLDESHTEDNSRITDMENETPSFSEDTFSKEDVFFSNSALGSAPVIPTSSQYGLVIVDPELSGVGCQTGPTLSNVHVSMTDAGINIVGSPSCKLGDNDQKDMHHRNERFKVVKIESTEPFKRGRWMCMDYLDHSTLQNNESVPSSVSGVVPSSQAILASDGGVVIVENNTEIGTESVEVNSLYNVIIQNIINNTTNSPGQTLQKSLSDAQTQPLSGNVTSMASGIMSQPTVSIPHTAGSNASQPNMVCPSYNQTHQALPTQQYSQPSHLQGQSHPAQFYQHNQQNQSTVTSIHGATLPSNITIQNGVPSTFVPTIPQQPSQTTQPLAKVTVGMPVSVSCTDPIIPTNNVVQSTTMTQPTSMGQVIQQPQQTDCFMPSGNNNTFHMTNMAVSNSTVPLPMDLHHTEVNTVPPQAGVVAAIGVTTNNNSPQNTSPAVDNNIIKQQPASNQSGQQSISSISQESAQSVGAVLNEGSSTVSTPQQSQGAASGNAPQQQQSSGNNDDEHTGALEADSESASGTSAVAIDNKIEQAMDLVKSHLMIAVREEVEVLKEKIAELMDRINQLELENTILKANVSQETLSQLSATMQTAPTKQPQNSNPNNGSAS